MKKLINQIIKFGFIGVICFIIDYGLMILLTEVLLVYYLISCMISFALSVIVNYYLSSKFVFKIENNNYKFMIFVLMSVIGLLLNQLFMWLFADKFMIRYTISKIIVTIIVMVYNFISRKLFLEKNRTS